MRKFGAHGWNVYIAGFRVGRWCLCFSRFELANLIVCENLEGKRDFERHLDDSDFRGNKTRKVAQWLLHFVSDFAPIRIGVID